MADRTIADTLFPALRDRYPDRGFRVEVDPEPCAVFPAAGAHIGDVRICDDGDEVTVYPGHFLHAHISNYDDVSRAEKTKAISDEVIELLDALFADRIAFWGARSAGGWRWLDSAKGEQPADNEYVWSRPRKAI